MNGEDENKDGEVNRCMCLIRENMVRVIQREQKYRNALGLFQNHTLLFSFVTLFPPTRSFH